jgi:hypothetical protein
MCYLTSGRFAIGRSLQAAAAHHRSLDPLALPRVAMGSLYVADFDIKEALNLARSAKRRVAVDD